MIENKFGKENFIKCKNDLIAYLTIKNILKLIVLSAVGIIIGFTIVVMIDINTDGKLSVDKFGAKGDCRVVNARLANKNNYDFYIYDFVKGNKLISHAFAVDKNNIIRDVSNLDTEEDNWEGKDFTYIDEVADKKSLVLKTEYKSNGDYKFKTGDNITLSTIIFIYYVFIQDLME